MGALNSIFFDTSNRICVSRNIDHISVIQRNFHRLFNVNLKKNIGSRLGVIVIVVYFDELFARHRLQCILSGRRFSLQLNADYVN